MITMNEAYLHYLWKFKRLPFHEMHLHDGGLIDVVDVGIHNENESGPDFFLSKIRNENITWVGSVEMHVSSSDWYKHKHHLDLAYDNVILHLVYNHDREVFVKDKVLPVLELKNYIDEKHFNKFLQIKRYKNSHLFPCKSYEGAFKEADLNEMMILALKQRLNRKYIEQYILALKTDEERLYWLFAKSFGTKINQQPFELLANTYSIEFLRDVNSNDTIIEFQDELFSNNLFQWKKKGLHNSSSPEKRIPIFIDFISNIDLKFPFWNLPTAMIYEYFQTEFKRLKISGKIIPSSILINAIAIFLFSKGRIERNEVFAQKAFRLLELLPSEENQIVRKWKEIQIIPRNAFESQALLEIYQQFCSRKRCLDCKIGINFLNS